MIQAWVSDKRYQIWVNLGLTWQMTKLVRDRLTSAGMNNSPKTIC